MEANFVYASNYSYDQNGDLVWKQHSVELNAEDEKAYLNAIRTGVEFAEAEGLGELYEAVMKQLESREEESYLQYESLVAMAAMGQLKMEPDAINDLVDKRDPYTLGYFGLTNASKERLAKWDANKLDDDQIPYMRDFHTNAEYAKPEFDEWKITVCFAAPDEEVVKAILRQIFTECEGEYYEVYEFLDNISNLNVDGDYMTDEIVQEILDELQIDDFEWQ